MPKIFEIVKMSLKCKVSFMKTNMKFTYLACINLQQLMVGIIALVVELTPQNMSRYAISMLFSFCRILCMCFKQNIIVHLASKGVATTKMVGSYLLILHNRN